jgi:hypothetical protein
MSERKRHRGAFVALHPTHEARLPTPIMVNGHYFFRRDQVEAYKHQLAGPAPPKRDPHAHLELVKLKTLADELGRHPMTIKRYFAGVGAGVGTAAE